MGISSFMCRPPYSQGKKNIWDFKIEPGLFLGPLWLLFRNKSLLHQESRTSNGLQEITVV